MLTFLKEKMLTLFVYMLFVDQYLFQLKHKKRKIKENNKKMKEYSISI